MLPPGSIRADYEDLDLPFRMDAWRSGAGLCARNQPLSSECPINILQFAKCKTKVRRMTEPNPTIAPRSLGYRIRAARDALGMTQEQVSQAMAISDRQTISAIEKGGRAVRPDELVRMAALLERDINYFIDPFVVAGEAQFSWRVAGSLADTELQSFEERMGAWVGMLRFLRRRHATACEPFGANLRLSTDSSFEDALAMGEAAAEKLQLGPVPAVRIVDQVEEALEIPVLFVDAVESPSGSFARATCHLPDLSVILINRNEPEAMRNHDLAHELFHALMWNKMTPLQREAKDPRKAKRNFWRIERLADNFAAGLLMPSSSLNKAIDSRRIEDIDHLRDVADYFRVSPASLACRLLNAKMIDDGLCERLSNQTSRSPDQTRPKRFSASFVDVVYRGIDKGQLSARKAAKAIGLTLPELVGLFEEHSRQPAPFSL